MSLSTNTFHRIRLVLSVLVMGILGACATTEPLPQVSDDGLELVQATQVDSVYRQPGANLSAYDRVSITDIEIAFRKGWERDQNQYRMGLDRRITQDDMDKIKRGLAEEFRKIFTEELEKSGYQVVDGGGEDVLELRSSISTSRHQTPCRLA